MDGKLPSIESLGAPLGFLAAVKAREELVQSLYGEDCLLVQARSLAGMQKEALVYSPSGAVWRLTCDEGPYLNGADVAPFPLAFVTAGLVISVTSMFRECAREENIELGAVSVVLDNYYSMEGSAIQGTMKGGASSPDLRIEAENIDRNALERLTARAIERSAAAIMFATAMRNAFSLHLNDELRPLKEMRAATGEIPPPPLNAFDDIGVLSGDAGGRPILSKLQTAESLFGVDGGAGSSLQAEQKRGLHVRGTLVVTPDGLYDIKIQLFKPIGSVFRFIGDDEAGGRAPSGMDYFSAGVAFCFMTQLGRYAKIVKQDLIDYLIVQETRYSGSAGAGGAVRVEPLDTHVYLHSNEELERCQKLVKMGEQTCFAHAALSATVPVQVSSR